MCNCSDQDRKNKHKNFLRWIIPLSLAGFVLLLASTSRAITLTESTQLLVLATPSPSPTQYSFDALVKLTKNQNYAVQQEAERVFQARKRVRAAITNLLPHIRPRSILAVAFTGPAGLIEAVGDILPFLFPSNWFNARASRRLAEAEDYAYASLRGNELYDVESLYYSYARDRILAQLIDQHLAWYEQVTKRLLAEEQAGTLARGSADYFQVNALKLKEDRSNLTEILWSERLALLHAAALDSADATLDFDTITAITLDGAAPLDFGPFQATSITNSFELKSLDEMINASYYTRKAIWFSYLDPSSDAAIGFGMGIPIQISRSQTREIEVLRTSTESLVKQKVIDSVLMFNESIKRYEIAKAESDSTQREMSRLIQRHDAGDSEADPTKFVDQLSSLEADILTFELNKLSQRYRAMIAKAKLNRLTLQGIYNDLDKPIESEETSGETLQ